MNDKSYWGVEAVFTGGNPIETFVPMDPGAERDVVVAQWRTFPRLKVVRVYEAGRVVRLFGPLNSGKEI